MAKLRTFVLVNQDKVISPPLISIREYGEWMEKTFDESICQLELYIPSNKGDGQKALEWHPGTHIGNFFDSNKFFKPELSSWFISSKSKAFSQLLKHNFVTSQDCRSTKLRLYTVNQIELYIKSHIDSTFNTDNIYLEPKQITLSSADI